MNNLEQVIEEIRKNEAELEHLNQERMAIFNAEKDMSRESFQRELSTVDRFIESEREKLANNRNIFDTYNKAYDLVHELDSGTITDLEEQDAKISELEAALLSLSPELRDDFLDRINAENEAEQENEYIDITEDVEVPEITENEARLQALEDSLRITEIALQSSVEAFQQIFENERKEITERGPLSQEDLEELENRYNRYKLEENDRLQRSRALKEDIENRISNLRKVVEQERMAREKEETKEEEKEKILQLEERVIVDPYKEVKEDLLRRHQAGEIDGSEMARLLQEATGNRQIATPEPENNETNDDLDPFKEIGKPMPPLLPPMGLVPVSDSNNTGNNEKDQETGNDSDNDEENPEPEKDTNKDGENPEPEKGTNKDGKNPEPEKGTNKDGEDPEPEKGINKDGEDPEPEKGINKDGEDPEPEKTSEIEKDVRGFYTIINELTEGLDVKKGTGKKYRASNIKVSREFKEELKSGNYLYNIVHVIPAIIKAPIKLIRKVINNIRYSVEERKQVATLKERINNLSEEDIKTIWEEYRGTRVTSERYPSILNVLLNERMQQYALENVTKLNSSMEEKYKALFESKRIVDACNEILNDPDCQENTVLIQEALKNREAALLGKAEMVKELREQYKQANLWLSGGAHGYEEDLKASTTKLSIVGKRFVRERNLSPELTLKQAEIEQQEKRAINSNDDEAALNAFIENEVLLSSNTEISNSIFGKRSTGDKYYQPLVEKLDYRDDPFIRDMITTTLVCATAISAINAANTHSQTNEILNEHQAEVNRANSNNEALADQVNEYGDRLVDNGNDFAEGMKAQANNDVIGATNTMERHTLDETGWAVGSHEFRTLDDATHEVYNTMADVTKNKIDYITSQYGAGEITRQQSLEYLRDVANDTQQELFDLYESYLPTLQEYAAAHPQFDLHGVVDSMDYILQHPGAIAKMNEGMVEAVQIGDQLSSLTVEQISAINSLPSDLKTTLFVDGAAAVALAYNVSKTMDEHQKAGKYGNEITDMVTEYINDKNEVTTTETTSKNSTK